MFLVSTYSVTSAKYQKFLSILSHSFQFEANHRRGDISLRAVTVIMETYVTVKKSIGFEQNAWSKLFYF
jgi:hypothetical protein